MTKGKIPRQRRFQFLFNMPLRDVFFCFSDNIKPKNMRNLNCIFHSSNTINFGFACSLHNSQVIAQGWIAQWSIFFGCLPIPGVQISEQRMARIESREKITSRIKREIIESIARQRPCFYCQGRRPTQLIDPQLIMYCVFTILRLRNNWTQMHP